jgi:hypothetical protein
MQQHTFVETNLGSKLICGQITIRQLVSVVYRLTEILQCSLMGVSCGEHSGSNFVELR